MKSDAKSVDEYLSSLPEKRKAPMAQFRKVLRDNLPIELEETMSYGMISFVVPHSIYPNGYHVDKRQPLPFISLASQKNYISFYHMGVYAFPDILLWFKQEYLQRTNKKPNIGKSCIRFRKTDDIPFDLIEELCSKILVEDYITTYEKQRSFKKSK